MKTYIIKITGTGRLDGEYGPPSRGLPAARKSAREDFAPYVLTPEYPYASVMLCTVTDNGGLRWVEDIKP